MAAVAQRRDGGAVTPSDRDLVIDGWRDDIDGLWAPFLHARLDEIAATVASDDIAHLVAPQAPLDGSEPVYPAPYVVHGRGLYPQLYASVTHVRDSIDVQRRILARYEEAARAASNAPEGTLGAARAAALLLATIVDLCGPFIDHPDHPLYEERWAQITLEGEQPGS